MSATGRAVSRQREPSPTMYENDGLAIHAIRDLFVRGGGFIGLVRTPCLAPSRYTGRDGLGGTDGSWGRMGGGVRPVAGHRRAVDEDLLGRDQIFRDSRGAAGMVDLRASVHRPGGMGDATHPRAASRRAGRGTRPNLYQRGAWPVLELQGVWYYRAVFDHRVGLRALVLGPLVLLLPPAPGRHRLFSPSAPLLGAPLPRTEDSPGDRHLDALGDKRG